MICYRVTAATNLKNVVLRKTRSKIKVDRAAALQKDVTQKLFEISTWNFNVIFKGINYRKMQQKKSKFSKLQTSCAP